MAQRRGLFRIVTPKGWAVLPPGAEAVLWPPVDLPKARALDLAEHRALLPISISVVKVLAEPGRNMYLLKAGRTYMLSASRTAKSSTPPAGVTHELRLFCGGPCDLSPLYFLSLPRGATAVVRGFIDVEPAGRWAPAPPPPEGDPKGGLDILADPQRAKALLALVYDKSKETRKLACDLGLWTPCPGEGPGRFTTAALHALRLIAHFLPDRTEAAEDEG
ncbi:hypothetical protein [Pyrobaculum aerophilum]|uniref:hypothetical protein n=1 Tax=Pyrobaculum aerophilum TaxID=13773 RepID=UPI00257DB8D1|nr:hypothetical protein [Pyrobaculum sp.]